MLKKTVTYEDFNGNQITEDFYFNLTKPELMDMELSKEGGLSEYIQKVISTNNVQEIVDVFKQLLHKSYGIKSEDGKRFVKNEQVLEEFKQSAAYEKIFIDLLENESEAANFVNGIIPKDMLAQVQGQTPAVIK